LYQLHAAGAEAVAVTEEIKDAQVARALARMLCHFALVLVVDIAVLKSLV
jgi:hypothetical protein